MSADEPFISLQNVRKVYRSKGSEFLAVSDVTMDVREGELVSLVGPARTKDLIFKARLVEAPEALALGLLNEVVPDVATLQRRADETAKLVASHAPITLEVTKEAVRRIRRTLTRDEGEDLILRAYMSEDFREGMDAFLNKRSPNWEGK